MRISVWLVAVIALALLVGDATAEDMERTWPGFRGHRMSGVAASVRLPVKWSRTEGVAWTAELPGRGWSSPIVWKDTVFVTSAIGSKPFKQGSTGIFGNDYAAELQKLRTTDGGNPEAAARPRYRVH
jgi:hypothetical protein